MTALSVPYRLLILLCTILISKACGPRAPAGETANDTAGLVIPRANEEGLALRLLQDLLSDPQTQAEHDRNDIVSYAIDHLLDVQSMPSGLYYLMVRPGEGELLQPGEQVQAHYRGYFPDGTEFDNSWRRGQPLAFTVGSMIDGWNEGLQLLRPGAQAVFLIPSHLGYGAQGLQNRQGKTLVPPNAVLIFELEVLK